MEHTSAPKSAAMRFGASSRRVSRGIGRAASATRSSTPSSRLSPLPCTLGFTRVTLTSQSLAVHRSRPRGHQFHPTPLDGLAKRCDVECAPMSLRFPSPDWCVAYKDAINANAAYKTSSKDWTHGVVAMVVTADPSIGIAEDLGMWL